MITLIVNSETDRQVFENLTLRELGAKLTELSKKYVLVFDDARRVHPDVGCDLYITIASLR